MATKARVTTTRTAVPLAIRIKEEPSEAAEAGALHSRRVQEKPPKKLSGLPSKPTLRRKKT